MEAANGGPGGRNGGSPAAGLARPRATLEFIRALKRLLLPLAPLAMAVGPVAGGAAAQSPALGTPAWVQVSVATVWIHPTSPRLLDGPALRDPARIEQWLGSMTVLGRLGLNGRVDTQMIYGRRVVVLGRSGKWSQVEIPSQTGNRFPNGVIGWVPSAQLTAIPAQGTPAPGPGQAVIVSVPSTWLYGLSHGAVGGPRFLLSYDTELPELSVHHGFVIVGLPGGGQGAVSSAAVARVDGTVVTGSAIVAQARLFLGLPYLWGGTSGFGYDCSGLVYSVFARYGVMLPRDAADQKRATIAVPLADARAGDLFFFAGPHGKGEVDHVGIYAGDGLMIDSPYTGAVVEEIPVQDSPAWPDFAGAGRVPAMA